MKITITHAVGEYRPEQTVDTDESTGRWLIEHGYADAAEADEDTSPRKRSRTPRTADNTE